jgi:poly(A) polymerase
VIAPSLLAEVRPLAERFVSAGFRVYLVGGIVRDQLLGRPLGTGTDIDLTTDATPDAVKAVLAGLADAVWAQGERFGTIGCRIGDRDYEITTHRGESYEPDSRKPSVRFSSELEHDLERRDFTVNAMAVEVPEGELVDPFGGRADLRAGVLRTPLSPEVSFSDDPLRMLRAARFISGYALTPDDALVGALARFVPRMAIVSVERRRDELDKLLAVDDPTEGFRFLRRHDLLRFTLRLLAESSDVDFERAMDAMVTLPANGRLRLASLLATCTTERQVVEREVRALRYGNDVVAEVGAAVSGAGAIWAHEGTWTAADVRRLASATGAHLDGAIALAATRVDTGELRAQVDHLRANERLDDLVPALDGQVVMRLLGLGPGVEVGRALAFLRELRITEGELVPEDAASRLLDWWSSRQGA